MRMPDLSLLHEWRCTYAIGTSLENQGVQLQ